MAQGQPHKRKVFLLKPEYPSYGISGSRGSGKSVLLEFGMSWYYRHDYVCLDWFASLDHENAYWCIPDTVQVCKWSSIPGDDEQRLIKYIIDLFQLKDTPQEAFKVIREDDWNIYIQTEHLQYKFALNKSMTKGKLIAKPSSMFSRERELAIRR